MDGLWYHASLMPFAPAPPTFPAGQTRWEYVVIWQRVGAPERFRHEVVAGSREEAAGWWFAHVSRALGANIDLWRIDSVRRARITED